MKLPDYLKLKVKPQICDECKWFTKTRRCLADIDQYAFLDKSTMHCEAKRTGTCLYFREADKTELSPRNVPMDIRSNTLFIDIKE